jgi:hypothetical protein
MRTNPRKVVAAWGREGSKDVEDELIYSWFKASWVIASYVAPERLFLPSQFLMLELPSVTYTPGPHCCPSVRRSKPKQQNSVKTGATHLSTGCPTCRSCGIVPYHQTEERKEE